MFLNVDWVLMLSIILMNLPLFHHLFNQGFSLIIISLLLPLLSSHLSYLSPGHSNFCCLWSQSNSRNYMYYFSFFSPFFSSSLSSFPHLSLFPASQEVYMWGMDSVTQKKADLPQSFRYWGKIGETKVCTYV